ncbi:MAG: hypothetical protein KAG61_11605 [Bacteriovoracaceae bacterium]|nr:hypothetical protein [Bacteriovoracaceae bacterium]
MKLKSLILLMLLTALTNCLAMMPQEGLVINGDGRGGGDVVYCRPDLSSSRYAGLYTLDYLLTRESDFDENSDEFFKFTNDSKAAMNIALSIASQLEGISPKASLSLQSFLRLTGNGSWVNNENRGDIFRVWIPTARLRDYKDEDFINDLPANCYGDDGTMNISQMILREDVNSNILYHYNKKLFTELKGSPLQMSYLLIHEWLRDYTVHAAVIRRVTHFLHSSEFFEAPPYKSVTAIKRMGIYFDRDLTSVPAVQLMDFDTGVGCSGECGYLDVRIKVRNVDFHKSVTIYYSQNGGPWSELPASYIRQLSHGYEEWAVETNFGASGHSIEFAVKYSVGGQIYWDNNYYKNYRGVFRYPNE